MGKKSPEKEVNTTNSDCWETNATFQNITVWNHDDMPSKDDAFVRAFHWFTVADAVSSPFMFYAMRKQVHLKKARSLYIIVKWIKSMFL